jgi:hypothetical protein
MGDCQGIGHGEMTVLQRVAWTSSFICKQACIPSGKCPTQTG